MVARTEARTPRLVRVTLTGPDLRDFEPPRPAGSVRLLIPDTPGDELVIPAWDGNAFRHLDGRRPVVRTLTPLRHDAASGQLDVDVVLHGTGPLGAWARAARPGDPAAVSGPGRGYSVDPDAARYVLAGDESAIPAIGQLLEALPSTVPTTVIVEVAHLDARVELAHASNVEVHWLDLPPGSAPGTALVPAVMSAGVPAGGRAWIAGEAAAVQRIRRHFFTDLGVSRAQMTVRGYWQNGMAGRDGE